MESRFWLGAAVVAAMSVAGGAQRPPTLVPLDATGLITYYIAEGIPTFGSRPGDNELATWAFDEWERAAGGAIRLEPNADERCLHEIGHARGLGHTTDEDDVMRTEGAAPNFDRYRQKLKTRADIAKVAWLSEADTSRIRGLYQR